MKQVQGRGKDQARAPGISLTARVGSAGELMLPARGGAEWSDDEDHAFELGGRGDNVAVSTKCRVAVSLNQLVDAVAVDGAESDTLLVIYCPSTNKLNDPTSLRARTSQLSRSFRHGLLSKSRSRRLPKEILQQVPEDSYHFYVQFASKEAADSMRMAVLGQARKFYECMVWLSKQFPMPRCQSSIMMLTCGRRDGCDGRKERQGVLRDTNVVAFTRRSQHLGRRLGCRWMCRTGSARWQGATSSGVLRAR